jgi:2-keto-4-pentenoate hydratase/2-oxohepta-3-ene-1,7-dioic acid hydratase in catechol pathway
MAGFVKVDSSIIDPGATIRNPGNTEQLDYEVEIVLVMAQPLVAGKERAASVLGYTIGNDVSPRDVGRPAGGPDLYSMKAQDQMAPVGPWITTLVEFGGPGQPSIEFSLKLNNEERQKDNTRRMTFSVDQILAFINQRNKLRAGDLIFTGTTGGTGMRYGRFLQAGDRVELEAEKIGVLVNTVGPKEPFPS